VQKRHDPAPRPACGTIQFASPVHAGIHTAPKIMISACMVVMELKNCGSKNCRPGLKTLEPEISYRHAA